jgi:hypothetical protein
MVIAESFESAGLLLHNHSETIDAVRLDASLFDRVGNSIRFQDWQNRDSQLNPRVCRNKCQLVSCLKKLAGTTRLELATSAVTEPHLTISH